MKPTALVVDDEADLLHLTAQVLEKGGTTVVAEDSDGDRALEHLREHRPDLAVIDMKVAGTVVQGYLAGIPRDDSSLTPRQSEVASLMEEGLANKEIAVRLDLSVRTVEVHRALVMKRLKVRNAAELASRRRKNRLFV